VCGELGRIVACIGRGGDRGGSERFIEGIDIGILSVFGGSRSGCMKWRWVDGFMIWWRVQFSLGIRCDLWRWRETGSCRGWSEMVVFLNIWQILDVDYLGLLCQLALE
jgi:hypothetical protein